MDRLTPERRSEVMSRIPGKHTGPEMAVRRFLHAKGLRYRLHDKRLPGTPDLVFPSRKVAVFVHGCFWHGHDGCKRATLPATRTEFWSAKISRNVERDRSAGKALREAGWTVLTVWQCGMSQGQLEHLAATVATYASTQRSAPPSPR